MSIRRFAVLIALAFLWVPLSRAQSTDWIPSGMNALAAHATFSTDFTFDKSMLNAMAQNAPEDERRIIAQLRSISVHSFRYSAQELYDETALDAVRSQFVGNGWQHLVTKQGNPDSPDPVRTDLWVRLAHADVQGVVLLVASERNVNLVVVDGMISPLDLLHLRGHFGIPRFSGDQFEGQK